MKIRFSILFWHIFVANLAWALACSGVVWYACSEADMLFTPFMVFQILLGWAIGILSGLVWSKNGS